jgi:hypothetical protein
MAQLVLDWRDDRTQLVLVWRDDRTQLVLDLLSSQECLWNVKSENYINRNIRDKALEEMVKQQLNIPDLTQEDVKLKIKSIRSRYSSELAKVLKSEKKWCWPKNCSRDILK